jgi:hypothetical protein
VAREAGAFEVLLQTLRALLAAEPLPADGRALLQTQLAQLDERAAALLNLLPGPSPLAGMAQTQSAQYQALAQSLREMALLEATMQTVATAGQRLLQRLTLQRTDTDTHTDATAA